MVTLAVRTWRTDGTTIVACRLANDASEPRVALLDSRVDGPTHVAPAYRSEDATLQVTVPANATVGAGFATPAEPTETAVELVEERAQSAPTPDAVLADLSEPRPPHEAVVAGEAQGKTNDETSGRVDGNAGDEEQAMEEVDTTSALDAIERRIDRLEAVAAATTVQEAADALAAEGGLDSVRRLDSRVRADRGRLTALAERALTLADRAEAAEPRIETLERLS